MPDTRLQNNLWIIAFALMIPAFAWDAYSAQNGIIAALNSTATAVCVVGLFWRSQAVSLIMLAFVCSFLSGLYKAHGWFSIVVNAGGLVSCLIGFLAPLLIPKPKPRALDTATIAALPPVDAEVQSLLDDGQKIAAIKLYRARHNVGLKEALAKIDDFFASGNYFTP